MGKRTRECLSCGVEYEYCNTCYSDQSKPTWMAEFHDENCKNIFDICTRFNMQLISKDEAKNALSACDLSNKNKFKPYIKRDLKNIFAEDKVTVKVDPETKEIAKDEVAVEVKPVARKRTKSKTHEVVNKEENK